MIVATIAFGSTWRNMIVQSPTPSARAACTYSKLRARRNSARTTPMSWVHENATKIANMIQRFGASTEERIRIT